MNGFFGGIRQSSSSKQPAAASAADPSSAKTNLSARYATSHGSHGHGTDGCGDDEDVSIFSIFPNHSTQNWDRSSPSSNNNKSSKNKGGGVKSSCYPSSSGASMMSDISWTEEQHEHHQNSDPLENPSSSNGSSDPFGGSHEFLIQCQDGQMVFVTSNQGKAIKTRCRHFRYLLGLSIMASAANNAKAGDDGATCTTTKTKQDYIEDRVVKKESWTIGTTRHIIELLTQGTTWIPNDYKRFEALKDACAEIDMPGLCLGSMINYHDILDQTSTLKFFELASATHKYQFKFSGVVQSWQWIHLLHKGILLLPARKTQQVLMLTVAPPTDGTTELPTSAKSPKIVTKLGGPPNHQRLAKCDELCSEFSVYSGGGNSGGSGRSKIQALLLILDLLSKGRQHSYIDDSRGKIGAATGKEAKQSSFSSSSKKPTRQPTLSSFTEEYKVVYKTLIGSLNEQDLNMMWRLTSSSYTLSRPEEERYLLHDFPQSMLGASSGSDHHHHHHGGNMDRSNHTKITEVSTSSSSSSSADNSSTSHNDDTASLPSTSSSSDDPVHVKFEHTEEYHDHPERYQVRTLTGSSFMILRHLFEPVNNVECGELTAANKTKSHSSFARSHLPASLILYDPSPDTLGRFLNAVATANAMNSSGSIVTDIGWDFCASPSTPSPSTPSSTKSTSMKLSFLFFFGGTSEQVHQVLEYLSDYSRSAIVEGLGDFNFIQRV